MSQAFILSIDEAMIHYDLRWHCVPITVVVFLSLKPLCPLSEGPSRYRV